MHNLHVDRVQPRGWLAWLVAIPALVLAAVFGFFVFLAVLGLALLVALALGVRLWWLRRRLHRAAAGQPIEGEFVVVRERSPRDQGRLR